MASKRGAVERTRGQVNRRGIRFGLALAACLMMGAASSPRLARAAGPASWDAGRAAAYLDQRTTWWMRGMGAIDHGTACVSCHTALPYALARSALNARLGEPSPSPVQRQLLDSVTKRVRLWQEVQPFLNAPTESRGTEAVLNALVLVTYDMQSGTLSSDTRQALDTMWARQLRTGETAGAWPWFGDGRGGYEPWEGQSSLYWGATLAAAAVGTAPGGYRYTPGIQDNLRLLKSYLRRGWQKQPLLNQVGLLWAATKLPGVLTFKERASIIDAVCAKQRPDGGWSTSSLMSATWKRGDGTPLETQSDGYGTGVVTFVLEQAGVLRTRAELKRALLWLARNQDRSTGAWPASSVNKQRDPASDVGKFMSDAATAYSVLALTAGSKP
jgi:squalene-hopene/tetraprenyl-beta-curcumene cyclase